MLLGLVDGGAGALGYDFAGVLVEGAGLGDGVDGFLDLGVGFKQDFEAFLLAEGGHEDFLFYFALDPVLIFGHFGFGVVHVVLVQIIAEGFHHGVVHFKLLGDGGLGAEIVAREAADSGFYRDEHVGAEKGLFKFVQLGRGHDNVGCDAAAAGNLATAVGELDLRGMLGDFALVVILVERNGFVIALNQAAAGSVVTRGS